MQVLGQRSHGHHFRNIASIALASVTGAALLLYSLRAPSSESTTQGLSCAPRLIVVDTSSEARSPKLSVLTQLVIEQAAQSAVVCESSLSTYAVSGGGEVTPILTSDNLTAYTPLGPTPEIRATRFTPDQRAALDRLVTDELRSAYRQGDPSLTSVSALFQLASEQSDPQTDVVFVTAGVNHDSVVDLDRPLATGQGVQLAKEVAVPRVVAHQITIVGLAQMDSTLSPPSPMWGAQVLAFNSALCTASRAARCRLFELASVTQILNNS
jgi:hypothetical protein